MRHTDGTLADLTVALNGAIDEISTPVAHADGTLASATSQLNALLSWAGSGLDPADGTLSDAVDTYNQAVTNYIKPGRNVNVCYGPWMNDGVTVPVPRYSKTWTIRWTDKSGNAQEIVRTLRYPNVLQNVPLRRLGEYMDEITFKELRIQYGIDVEDD